MPNSEPTEDDFQQLRLLSIFHYIVGGITGLFGCFPILHLLLGIALVAGKFPDEGGQAPPVEFGWFFIVIAAFMIGIFWSAALAIMIAGRKLVRHTGWMYCVVVAGIECLFAPFGTVLGVFTLIVLMRPSVKALFSYGGVQSSEYPL